ncbi:MULTISPECIES: M28 family metallopeptidase [unclassified Pedobacter]|uniref:M28 family metallopeptidase n=1 Tax=unclassified Pedobacter TaxID=2628915 RepID=UPI001DED7975|nr:MULTISPECIES: M28 family metallopeptidase [unclassified Pedobacter]CAH0259291.1 Bacterial leucyl aminopeptidase [Pedobacter sp. Bi36]CAH0286265.1 Bacterial leucyl aminopeptidase [Pedobacter sp. Bi126]
MKKIYTLLLLVTISLPLQAQVVVNRNQDIDKMVKAVNQDSLKSYISKMVSFGTRNTLSDIKSKTKGIGAARNWVVNKFNQFAKQSDGRLTAYLDTITFKPDGKRVDQPTLLGNAVAILKGTDANDKRVYVVSGHLDSRVTDVMNRTSDAPGANDDGSGVAGVIEAARIMSRYKFPATIIFVAVSGEEQSLLGSGFMAAKAKKENWNVDAMLNNDMIGSNNSSETQIIDNTRLRVFSEGLPSFDLDKNAKSIRQFGLENDGKSRQLARYVKEIGERYVDQLEVKLIYRNDRFLRGGDHTPFVENGFTAVRITEMNENFDHQHQDLRTEKGIKYGDLQEFMDFEYLRKNTGVNIAVLANLAKAPSSPTEVKIDVKNLSNATFLYWKAPANGTVKGYYVLMRETSSAVWEKKFFTSATELRLPYSKDNYLFAVQSVGNDDNESLPVVPGIGR